MRIRLRLLLLAAFSCLLISAAEARPRRARPNVVRPNRNAGARVRANEQTHRVKVINCADRYMDTVNASCNTSRIAMTNEAACQRVQAHGKVLIRNNRTFVRYLGNRWTSWTGRVTVRSTQDQIIEVTNCEMTCRLSATPAQINRLEHNQRVTVQLARGLTWSRGMCHGRVRSIR